MNWEITLPLWYVMILFALVVALAIVVERINDEDSR